MERKHQVFVSSTYKDLQEERQQVIQALLELDCIPVGMELFPAANEEQWALIKDLIYDCDYYILIIAGRYGSIHPTKKLSYTQIEYEYALKQKVPILSFIHKNLGKIESDKSEQDTNSKAKLMTFIKLAEKKLCKYWETPAELKSAIAISLTKLKKKEPRPGWIKSVYLGSFTSDVDVFNETKGKYDTMLTGIWDEYYKPDEFKEKEQKQILTFNLEHRGEKIYGTLIGDDNPNYQNLPAKEKHDLRKFVVTGRLEGTLVSLTAILDSNKDIGHTVYLLETKHLNTVLEGITVYYDLDAQVITTARTTLIKRR